MGRSWNLSSLPTPPRLNDSSPVLTTTPPRFQRAQPFTINYINPYRIHLALSLSLCDSHPLGPSKNKGVKQKCSTTLNTFQLGFRYFFPLTSCFCGTTISGFIIVSVIRPHHSPPHADGSEVRQCPESQSSHTIIGTTGSSQS